MRKSARLPPKTPLPLGLASAFVLLGRLFALKLADTIYRCIAWGTGMMVLRRRRASYILLIFGFGSLGPARVLHGLGEGFFITASVAWVVDIAPADRRAQAMGILSSGGGGGVSVGPAIGQALGPPPKVAVFLTASSLSVLAFMFFTEEGLPGPTPSRPPDGFRPPSSSPASSLAAAT